MGEERRGKEKGRKGGADIFDIFDLRVLGIDFGELIRSWTGITDLGALTDPKVAKEVGARVEERRRRFREAQEQLRKKYGDAIRVDYDVRIGSLLGGKEGLHIGGGEFFGRLDELAKERREWRERLRGYKRAAPYVKKEGVKEPPMEVIEGKDYLEVIAEVPGVEDADVKLEISEEKLAVSADTPERKYSGELKLPGKVLTEPIERTYKNGILRLKLKRKG